MTPFDAPAKNPFGNTVGKVEIAGNEQFLLYLQFSTCLENFPKFSSNLKLASADCFNSDLSKILSSGNGLKTALVQVVAVRIVTNLSE